MWYLELSDDVRLIFDVLAVRQAERAAEVDEVVKRFHFLQRRREHLHRSTNNSSK